MTADAAFLPTSFDRDDIELVKLLLRGYRGGGGNSYAIESRPDTTERKEKAVEAIAVAPNGKRLAIEHTSVHPFEGKKADDVPFVAVFEQLRTDPSFGVANRFFDILVPVAAVPKGVVWKELAPKVRDWFMRTRITLPVEGETDCDIPGLGFPLKVRVQTMALPETEGGGVVGRMLSPGNPFSRVLQRALQNKVPKLVATPSEVRILLLEDEGVSIGFQPLIRGIDDSVAELPELKAVDEVWCAHTMGWKSSGDVFFCHVWPGGVQQRFRIKDERFRAADETKA